jgi:hypothetical protein
MAIATLPLKTDQLEALQAILPPTAEVSDMLRAWRGADALERCAATLHLVLQNLAVDRLTENISPQVSQAFVRGVVTSPFALRRRFAALRAIARSWSKRQFLQQR